MKKVLHLKPIKQFTLLFLSIFFIGNTYAQEIKSEHFNSIQAEVQYRLDHFDQVMQKDFCGTNKIKENTQTPEDIPINGIEILQRMGIGTWNLNDGYGTSCTNDCSITAATSCGGSAVFRVPVVYQVSQVTGGGTIPTNAELTAQINIMNDFFACQGIPMEYYECQPPVAINTGSSVYSSSAVTNIPNVVNIYVFHNTGNGTGCNGFAFLPTSTSSPTTSVMSYACYNGYTYTSGTLSCATPTLGSALVLIHEMGHYFGLRHTHDTSVACDDPNITTDDCTNGDQIEDTDEDPDYSGGEIGCTGCMTGGALPSCAFNNASSTNCIPYGTPNTLDNVMSYNNFSGCRTAFTPCQRAKMVDALLCARGPQLCCRDVMAEFPVAANGPDLEICSGDPAPTFTAGSNCYTWYDGLGSSATALATNSMTFTPTIGTGPGQLNNNAPGTYTWYLGDLNEVNPNCRTAVTVTVFPDPGAAASGGVSTPLNACTGSPFSFTTTGANVGSNFNMIGWYFSSSNPTSITTTAGITSAISGATNSSILNPTTGNVIQSNSGTPPTNLNNLGIDCAALSAAGGSGTYYLTPFVAFGDKPVVCESIEPSTNTFAAGSPFGTAYYTSSPWTVPCSPGSLTNKTYTITIEITSNTTSTPATSLYARIINPATSVCGTISTALTPLYEQMTGTTHTFTQSYITAQMGAGFCPTVDPYCISVKDPSGAAGSITYNVISTVTYTGGNAATVWNASGGPDIGLTSGCNSEDCFWGAPIEIDCNCTATCPSGLALSTAPPVTVVNSTCTGTATSPSGGSISAPTAGCPAGSTLEYSIDGGATWSTTLPTYNQTMAMTILTRCVCDANAAVVSMTSSVMTVPGTCACPTLSASTAPPVIVVNSTCTGTATSPSGGSISAPTAACPAGSTLEYSIDGGATWSTTLPTYNQTMAMTILTRCVCDANAAVVSMTSSVTTVPGTCACPTLSASTAPAVTVVNSTCTGTATSPSGGSISAPTAGCPAGSTLEYSIDGGATWSTTLPTYNQTMAMTILTRCVCDANAAVVSMTSSVMTVPGTCACPTLSASTAPPVIVVNSTCTGTATSPSGGSISAPTAACPAGSTLEYSIDGGATWSTTLPTYNQTMAMTILTRCVCDANAAVVSMTSSVTTVPGTCACPTLSSSTAPAVTVVNSTCTGTATSPSGGSISAPTAACPAGSTLEYSIDGGATWSTTLPTYNQTMAMTILTRCVCDANAAVVSMTSSVTTVPGTCACPTLSSSTAPAVTVVNSTCTGTATSPSGGSISAPTAACPAGSTLEYSIDGGATWSTTLPTYNQTMSMTILTRCVCDANAAVVSMTSSVTTVPGTCACPTLSASTAPPVTVVNSTCTGTATSPTGGSISAPTAGCPAGSTLEYSIDGGTTWSTTLPTYNQTMAMTILTRCVCDANAAVVSMTSSVTTVPGTCACPTLSSSTAPAVTVVNSMCTGTATSPTGGSISAPTAGCPAGSTLEYSIDGGTTWSTTLPTYNQTMAMTILTRCVCDANAALVSMTSSVTTVPGTCACPTLSASTAPAVTVVNSTCTGTATSPSGGSISAPTAGCPAGSTLEYSIDGGTTWSTTLPTYNQTMAMTILTRCVCDANAALVSMTSSVTTVPGTCACPTLSASTAPAVTVVNSTCTGTATSPSGGSISAPTAGCPAGSTLEYSIDGGATWSTTLPTYNQTMAMTILTRCVCDVNAAVVSMTSSVTTVPGTCACPTLSASTAPAVTVVNSTCTGTATSPSGGSISAPTAGCPAGSTLEYSIDGGTTWSTTLPTYNQTMAMTILTRCVCDANAALVSMTSSVTTVPGICPCPTLSTSTAPAVTIVNSTCTGTATSPSGGSISAPTAGCPAGSTLEYSIDGGVTWSTTLPTYNQTMAMTILTRCVCDANAALVSMTSSVTTVPGICPTCILSVTCPASTDLGNFDCTNLNTIPTLPTSSAEAAAAPYNIIIGTNPCGTIAVFGSDDMTPDGCTTTNQSITRTITVFDDLDGDNILDAGESSQVCTYTYTIIPNSTSPVAVCNDITITLDGTGNYTLTPTDISVIGLGSTASCGLNLSVSPNVFDCTNVGPVTVTLTVADDCGATDMCSAVVNVIASQFCIDNFPPTYINEGGPMISDPCTCRGNGEFDEEVFVESTAPGQMWTITSVSGLTPWSVGDVLTDNGDGTYSAVGIHLDGVGFSIQVESNFFPGLTLGISNVCHYPKVEIESDLGVLCSNTPIINLIGSAGLQSDGVTPVDGIGEFKVNGVVTSTLDPATLGVGSHTVEFCFDAGDALGFTQLLGPGGIPVIVGPPDGANSLAESQDDPGCESCVSEIIVIGTTSSSVVCNDGIQISLQENCEALITADMILEGINGCFDDYSVALSYGNSSISNPISNNYINQTITAQVTHVPSGNVCWGTLTVEDKLGPVFDCNITLLDKLGLPVPTGGPDVFYFENGGFGLTTGPLVFVPCDYDLSSIPSPNAIDNCDVDATEFLISEDVQDLTTGCPVFNGFTNTRRVDRRYGSSDNFGNGGDECTITIMIYIPTIEFPDDITWTCEQYDLFSNITDPTALHPFIIENAAFLDQSTCHTTVSGDEFAGIEPYTGFNYWTDAEALDVDLDPYYDDNFDNPINDSSGACGTPTDETDTECIHNISAIRVGCGATGDCDTDPHDHRENIITVPLAWVGPFAPGPQYPLYRAPNFTTTPPLAAQPAHPVNGLEDADLLELSGSGVPNLYAQHGACNHTFTNSDQILEACTGQGTSQTFKILRTWTALNWCTGQVTTDVQVIKVIDKRGPTISIAAQELISDQTNSNGNHTTCTSSGLIAPPSVSDACAGVTSVRVFTPAGEAIAVTDASGDVIGYRIPSPYLEMGTHTITVEAHDACGNSSTTTAEVTVIDGIPPVNICREVTQVALASPTAGITSVAAKYFDEGSYDYCNNVYFKVRKMELGTCDNANIDKFNEVNNPRNNRCILDPKEYFDDDVKFCCDEIGTTVNVILRVYDEDPDFLATCGPKTGAVLTEQTTEGLHTDIIRGFVNRCYPGQECEFRDASSLNDNYNDCMIEVLVEDKSRPTCVAPADVWINCDELPENVDYGSDSDLDALFGTASVADNCGADLEYVSVNEQLNLCGVGRVTRTFRAVDASGNRSLGSCSQVIMVQPVTSYCITFPEDFVGECDNNNNPDEIEFVEIGCDLLAISKESRPFNAGGPAGDECRKDLITWKVINWCEYDGISAPTVVNRDGNGDGRVDDGEYCSTGSALIYTPNPTQIQYSSTGYYSWEQHVKIFDNTAPEVSYDGDVKFHGGDLDEDPCTGQVDIAVEVNEQCTDATTTTWAISAFSSTFVSATFNGSDAISARYPLGTHTARFYVSDDCGNTSTIDITFDVVDAKAPTPVCYNGLSIDVMPASGMVEAWATDFDASSFDYCQDIKFAINRIEDRNGDGFITSDDHVTTVPNTSNVVFTCDDIGTLVYVQLWVGEVPGDGCNDWDYCTTFMEVQDNNGVCNGLRPATVGGNIADEKGESVENVEVTINGDMTETLMTTNNGQYHFDVVEGNDYSITPMKLDDIRNGVSTFDLALISKHVLNVQSLNSPYKLIAADANRSGSITTLDLVAIRKVVLFVANDFPNNTSWRFVDKDYIFTNPQNPFAQVFPEVKNYNNISGVNMADFVGIKIGDVSGDAKANGLTNIDDRTFNETFYLNTEDETFQSGERIEVSFTANLTAIEGYQATLNFDYKVLELEDIESTTLTKENFGLTMVEEGIITTSWNGTARNKEAFTLIFSAKAKGKVSEELSISSQYTKAEAYAGNDLLNVDLNFGAAASITKFALHQNIPNPFKSETTIGFDLPKADEATLTISDVSGKVLRVIKGNYESGYNSIVIDLTNNLPYGVLIYELETSTDKATKKMTLMR